MNNEPAVQSAVVHLSKRLEQDVFQFSSKVTQRLLCDLMDSYANNLRMQLAILKIIEYSLHSVVSKSANLDRVDGSGAQDLRDMTVMNSTFLEKIFYLFLVSLEF